MEFDDLGSDDDWVMEEDVDGGTEILDEDLVEVNQDQIGEDEDIVVHNFDENDGGRDVDEVENGGEDENEDEGDNGNDDGDNGMKMKMDMMEMKIP